MRWDPKKNLQVARWQSIFLNRRLNPLFHHPVLLLILNYHIKNPIVPNQKKTEVPHQSYFFHLAMDQYLYIPFLGGWTSIYQLFWCSPEVQGFDSFPFGWVLVIGRRDDWLHQQDPSLPAAQFSGRGYNILWALLDMSQNEKKWMFYLVLVQKIWDVSVINQQTLDTRYIFHVILIWMVSYFDPPPVWLEIHSACALLLPQNCL